MLKEPLALHEAEKNLREAEDALMADPDNFDLKIVALELKIQRNLAAIDVYQAGIASASLELAGMARSERKRSLPMEDLD